MPKNGPVQSCGALKLASFPGSPVIKISKLANMNKFDTIEKSIKNVTKNAKKPMPKNVPVQSYEAFKLVSFSAWPVTKTWKLANMKNFNFIEKSIHDQKHKETHA